MMGFITRIIHLLIDDWLIIPSHLTNKTQLFLTHFTTIHASKYNLEKSSFNDIHTDAQAYIKVYQGSGLPEPKSMLDVGRRIVGGGRYELCVMVGDGRYECSGKSGCV